MHYLSHFPSLCFSNLLYIKVYRKGSGRFDELTCNTEESQNGVDVYHKNASTLNPFATEFSFKYLSSSPATFYNPYQNQPSNLLTTVDSSPAHQIIEQMPSHSTPYVINQNCPPLANQRAVPLPMKTSDYHPPHSHTRAMVVHHISPPIPLQPGQQVQTMPAIQPVAIQALPIAVSVAPAPTIQYYSSNINMVELFPDVYQNDEASFCETNLGKYDSNSTLKRMQNHLMSGGACFVPATSPPNAAQLDSPNGAEGGRSSENRSPLARPISVDNGKGARTRTAVIFTSTDEDTKDGTDSSFEKSESSDSLNCSTTFNRPKPKRGDVNDLNREQLDELYEEPLGTDNAMKAVMGYVPKDDKRICKHYDPKTKGCFKGNNCKLEHVNPIKGKQNILFYTQHKEYILSYLKEYAHFQ